MKKLFAGLCFILIFTLCACSGLPDSSVPDSSSSGGGDTSEEKTYVAENLGEAINELKSSPYKKDIKAEFNAGLKDIANVGADEKAFSTMLYPAPEDSACDKVYYAAQNGLSPENADNTAALNSLIVKACRESGVKKIVFEAKTYKFSSTIKLDGAENLCLQGLDGTIFLLTDWMTAFSLSNCKNVRICDVAVDYDPSPNVSGRVSECDPSEKSITLKVGSEFDLSLPIYKNGEFLYGSYMEYQKDEQTGRYIPREGGNLKYNEAIVSKSYDESTRKLTLKFDTIKDVDKGTLVSVAFTMYNNPAVSLDGCRDVYFENTDVYSAPGMAFYCVSCRNVYFNRSDVRLKSGSSRLMTATADGIHMKDATGEVKITGGVYEASHDDSVNICNFYKNVVSASGDTLVCEGRSGFDFPLERGNVLDVYRISDYGYVTTLKVKSVKKNNLTYTLKIEGDLSGVGSDCMVGNATRVPRVTIANNVFRNKRNRGILAQFRNSKIINNTFENIAHGAIMMHSTYDPFLEAIVPKNNEISGNKFINNNYGSGHPADVFIAVYGKTGANVPSTITGIKVENNFFYKTYAAPLYLCGGGNCSVSHNLAADVSRGGNGDLLSLLQVYTSTDIAVNNNCAAFSEERSGFKFVKGQEDASSQDGNFTENI